MDIVEVIVKISFVLFLVYTIIYIFQTFVSLFVSLNKFSDYSFQRQRSKHILSLDIAKKAKVSFIIPAFNEGDCILKTIDSILDDDYPNLEVIIVNDGSTDNTEQLLIERYGFNKETINQSFSLKTKPIISSFKKTINDRTLVLVTKENGGKADALNCGLNLATNPLCVMLDADTRVVKGSIRIMTSYFLMNHKTIVCAGAIESENLSNYPKLSLLNKMLVIFQTLEYYRTFYMQRIMFDSINANIIVSGAFAMFKRDLVIQIGGYHTNTIGEDMELTMRLHAFCASQNKEYHIAYAPEAKCITQLPFRYHDFFNQRRRWQIGMMQSMKLHTYMLGNGKYGWAGIMSGTFFLLYELFEPFIEIFGIIILIMTYRLNILNLSVIIKATIIYALIIIFAQFVLVKGIHQYKIEHIHTKQRISLFLVSIIEMFFFHPFNVLIKLVATLTSYRHQKTWKHLERIEISR